MSDNDNNLQATNGNGRDSWVLWQKIVLSDIDRNEKNIKELADDHNKFVINMTKEITALKVKAAIWGAGAGLVMSTILYAIAQSLIHISK